jgi:SAM-dependent methyltransferase
MTGQQKFGEDYFRFRQGNDPRRQRSYQQERAYLVRRLGEKIFQQGRLLDVGCSTGEFIAAIGWTIGNAYGMEVSAYARSHAEKKGIRFDRDLANSEGFFDLVVFRGTIQYIPSPFEYIQRASVALKPGGHVLFLATPNTNSAYYRAFKTIPFLEEEVNYWVPCDSSLRMVLRNAGFEVLDIQYPYWRTPYSKPLQDHLRFVRKVLFRTEDKFAFWRSSMSVLARKQERPPPA